MKHHSVEIRIVDYGKKGNGIGYFQLADGIQREASVPFTMPGDRVQALLLRKRSGKYEAKMEHIIEPSKDRIVPKCIHFGICGGCKWQHVPYEQQLQVKEKWIRNYLASFGTHETTWHPIIPCDPPWQYRNKMEFTFSSNKMGEKYLGLIISGSKGRVLNLTECHLVNEWCIQTLRRIWQWWEERGLSAYFPPANRGSLQSVTMREGMATGDRMVVLTVSGNPEDTIKKQDLNAFVSAVCEVAGSCTIFLRIRQTIRGKPVQFYEMHLHGPESIQERMIIDNQPIVFQIGPQSFFQPSTRQGQKLYQRAIDLVGVSPGVMVLDLFCGIGAIGICAAQRAGKVIGIEISPESVVDARENIKLNGIKNMEVLQGDVAQVLQNHLGVSPDLIFVDPPRVGLGVKTLEQLLALHVPTIVYISCNPATQAKDIEQLTAQKYVLTDVQPVDQFPQTYHVEIIAILRRR